MEYIILYFITGLVISGLVIIYFALSPKTRLEDPDYERLKETIWKQRVRNITTGIISWPLCVYGFIERSVARRKFDTAIFFLYLVNGANTIIKTE
jgi:hypothetical protein